MFCCFKWLLNCRLDFCQQKGAICSFTPREYNFKHSSLSIKNTYDDEL